MSSLGSPQGTRKRRRTANGKSAHKMEDSEMEVMNTNMQASQESESPGVVEEAMGMLSNELDEANDLLQKHVGATCCARDYDLHHYQQLPDYLKHTPHILQGYRVGLSMRQTTFSFFHWHNESLNVWTHAAGFLLFFILAIVSYATWLAQAAVGEVMSSTAFFAAALLMMLFSTLFHLYNCRSSKHYDIMAKLDYSGIAILIVGSYYPLLYYMYYCPEEALWRYGYGTIITLFGVAAMYNVWRGKMHTAGNEAFRLIIFLGMGLFGVIPLPHSIVRPFSVHDLTVSRFI